MKLQPKPYELIEAGTKTIELRLNDEKRQAMAVGDLVIFSKEPENVETLTAVIVERLAYPTFAELKASFTTESLGLDNETDTDNARPVYYTEEDETRFGALGLRIQLHGC